MMRRRVMTTTMPSDKVQNNKQQAYIYVPILIDACMMMRITYSDEQTNK